MVEIEVVGMDVGSFEMVGTGVGPYVGAGVGPYVGVAVGIGLIVGPEVGP